MPLLNEDVRRIVGLGFRKSYFATDSEDLKVLRNNDDGRCVFHDGEKCTIYRNRPAGCRLYPIIFDENSKRAVKDTLCPFRSEFANSQKIRRNLLEVYSGLVEEAKIS